MKKKIAIFGSLVLTTVATSSVISCKKESEQFNQFKNFVNTTKGAYDEKGEVLAKSSASVIYIGAKDNASSNSFEYALEKVFGSVDKAVKLLSHEQTIKISNPVVVAATVERTADNERWQLVVDLKDNEELVDADYLKIEWANFVYDAHVLTIAEDEKTKTVIHSYGEKDFTGLQSEQELQITLTGYSKTKQNSNIAIQGIDNNSANNVVTQWCTAYEAWLENLNGDRSITDVQIDLDAKSKEYGKVSAELETPVYGIKDPSDTAVITSAYDYAKPQFTLQVMSVNSVSDYWNNDLFKSISNDILKPDLLYQFSAHDHKELSSDKEESKSGWYKKRVEEVNKWIAEIQKSKGPLFLVVKNGHVINIKRGWNVYDKFAVDSKNVPNEATFNDLLNWAQELQTVLENSFQNNTEEFNSFGVERWQFAETDDSGESNWDHAGGSPKN